MTGYQKITVPVKLTSLKILKILLSNLIQYIKDRATNNQVTMIKRIPLNSKFFKTYLGKVHKKIKQIKVQKNRIKEVVPKLKVQRVTKKMDLMNHRNVLYQRETPNEEK